MREIPLSRGMVALVDDEDAANILASGPWHAYPNGASHYARHSITPSLQVTLHSFLTGWPLVDHVNGNGLDNRRANLRFASVSQNAANRGPARTNTSGFKGVVAHKARWKAQIRVRGHQRHIGLYETREEAARAYDAAAIAAWGEFARPNFPLQETA